MCAAKLFRHRPNFSVYMTALIIVGYNRL
jgi:Diacylglycerol kinase accessory domain